MTITKTPHPQHRGTESRRPRVGGSRAPAGKQGCGAGPSRELVDTDGRQAEGSEGPGWGRTIQG